MQYIDYLNLPQKIVLVLVILFAVSQVIGAIINIKGGVAPGILTISKKIKEKHEYNEQLKQLPALMAQTQKEMAEIAKRHEEDTEMFLKQFEAISTCLDKNTKDTTQILIESKRNAIIDFASACANERPYTREQFHRIFKTYEEYESLIEENGLTNGEVEISIKIIRDEYEKRTREHTFIEDIRNY